MSRAHAKEVLHAEGAASGRCEGGRAGLLARSALRQDGDVQTRHVHSDSQDTAPSQQRPKVVANRQVFALVFRTHMTAAHSAAFIRTTFGALNRRHPTVFALLFLFSREAESDDDIRVLEEADDIRRGTSG